MRAWAPFWRESGRGGAAAAPIRARSAPLSPTLGGIPSRLAARPPLVGAGSAVGALTPFAARQHPAALRGRRVPQDEASVPRAVPVTPEGRVPFRETSPLRWGVPSSAGSP